MKKIHLKTVSKQIIADTLTPVSIYMRVRDKFPRTLLLESSDFQGSNNSISYICMLPIAGFEVQNADILETFPDGTLNNYHAQNPQEIPQLLSNFVKRFKIEGKSENAGLFGYSAYSAIKYFEDIKLKNKGDIPDMLYHFYRYVIRFDHFNNKLEIIEFLHNNQESKLPEIELLITKQAFNFFAFSQKNKEKKHISDQRYLEMVKLGKKHCRRGDVFQIVLSRRFSQAFTGDDFTVYRALRHINPSPYLFYFDYGSFKLFGSSPEAQIVVQNGKAVLNPIAGTAKRGANATEDAKNANQLANDSKENAEHVMLVDLARNDISKSTTDVKVEVFRELQYYSHLIHLVSKVSGQLKKNIEAIRVMADTFPAGTLSGAPKHRAMMLIDQYENETRGYYAGAIGFIGLNGDINHAIMIRTFMSKKNRLHYQAGAGIVDKSIPENELQEVVNKLAALRKAIELAETL